MSANLPHDLLLRDPQSALEWNAITQGVNSA